MLSRLRIDGDRVSSTAEPARPIVLRGFTFDYIAGKPGQSEVTPQDRNVTRLLPGTNLARLVMVHWMDDGTTASGHDCYNASAMGHGYLTTACLDLFDGVLHWATQEARMWATVTMRAALAAGDGGEGGTVWSNATLRAQMVEMWRYLAWRYRNHGGVAGYEVMSEPRWDGSDAEVHRFHADACAAVWSSDAEAACFIGPATYYNRYKLGPQWLLPGNVVYAANFFEPKGWITAATGVPYGGSGECVQLAERRSCGGESYNVTLDRRWLHQLLAPAANFSAQYQVPVWIDQWGLFSTAGTSDADRAAYLADALSLFGAARLHWAMWIWRRPRCGQDGYALVCERGDGSGFDYFDTAIDQLSCWIGEA